MHRIQIANWWVQEVYTLDVKSVCRCKSLVRLKSAVGKGLSCMFCYAGFTEIRSDNESGIHFCIFTR
jgi:hypothetical protein